MVNREVEYLKHLINYPSLVSAERNIDYLVSDEFFIRNREVEINCNKLAAAGLDCDDGLIERIKANLVLRDLTFLLMAGKDNSSLDFENSEYNFNFPEGFDFSESTLFLGTHDYFQLVNSLQLASFGHAMSAFAISPDTVSDPFINELMKKVYGNIESALNGGTVFLVGGNEKPAEARMMRSFFARVARGENMAVAIDICYPGAPEAFWVDGRFGRYRLLDGVVNTLLDAGYKVCFGNTRRENGRYECYLKYIEGSTISEILEGYVKLLEERLVADPAGWEGIKQLEVV